ncbi:DUF2203 domain-containing protein [Brevibacillus fluminis]|uniref:DUF2203 domain-containing protein n=1 Tax=Brevibacillus fluminis TaxID=511487 RepID=UPI003F8A2328
MAKRYFTLDEANSLLPFMQGELSFMQAKRSDFLRAYKELQVIKQQPQAKTSQLDEAIFKLECSMEFMQLEIQLHLDAIHAKGIQVKDIDIGLIDFPALIDGAEVLLCWKQGEPRISHYHGLYDGFSGRKPL